MVLSYAALRRDSVSLLRFLFLIQVQGFSWEVSFVCRLKCTDIFISLHIILLLWEFFTPASANGLSRRFERQQDLLKSCGLYSVFCEVVWMFSTLVLISTSSWLCANPFSFQLPSIFSVFWQNGKVHNSARSLFFVDYHYVWSGDPVVHRNLSEVCASRFSGRIPGYSHTTCTIPSGSRSSPNRVYSYTLLMC